MHNNDIQKLHNRIDLLIRRCEHLETYLGHRDHPFPEGERLWDMNQVQRDVQSDSLPRSHFQKGMRRRRTQQEKMAA